MEQGKRERIADVIDYMAAENSVDVYIAWNDYASDCDPEDEVYDMDTFNEYFDDPWEATRAAFFGEFNPTDNYFWFDAYGNLESSNYLDETPLDPDALAEHALGMDEDFGLDEVREILDEPEDDDEDEAA